MQVSHEPPQQPSGPTDYLDGYFHSVLTWIHPGDKAAEAGTPCPLPVVGDVMERHGGGPLSPEPSMRGADVWVCPPLAWITGDGAR